MTTFDEREHAFEAKLAHDEELKFKARARRDKRLGLWAAGLLGTSGGADRQTTIQTIRREVEGRLGKKAAAAQKDLPALLERAAKLPSVSF